MGANRRCASMILLSSMLLVLASTFGTSNAANRLQQSEPTGSKENVLSPSASGVEKGVALMGTGVGELVRKDGEPMLPLGRPRILPPYPVPGIRKRYKILSLDSEAGKRHYKLRTSVPDSETILRGRALTQPEMTQRKHLEVGNYIGEKPNFAAYHQQGSDRVWCDNPYRCEGGKLCPPIQCSIEIACCRITSGTCCQDARSGSILLNKAKMEPSSHSWIKTPKIHSISAPPELLGYREGIDYYSAANPLGPPTFVEANKKPIHPASPSAESFGYKDTPLERSAEANQFMGPTGRKPEYYTDRVSAGGPRNVNPFIPPSIGQYENNALPAMPDPVEGYEYYAPPTQRRNPVPHTNYVYLPPYVEADVVYNAYNHNENQELSSTLSYGSADVERYKKPFGATTRLPHNKYRDAYAVGTNSLAVPSYAVHRAPVDHYNFHHPLFGSVAVAQDLEGDVDDTDDNAPLPVLYPPQHPTVYQVLHSFSHKPEKQVYAVAAPVAYQPQMPAQSTVFQPLKPHVQPHVYSRTYQTPRLHQTLYSNYNLPRTIYSS